MIGAVERVIGVVGLGYVGLPVALALSRHFRTIGYDVNQDKVECIRTGKDPTDEGFDEAIRRSTFKPTSDIAELEPCNFFVVCVPTPIDKNRVPDLSPLYGACEKVGSVLKKGDIVVFESTVYPGVTEEICAPRLAEISGLKPGSDFFLGYSPERINPGDTEHTFEAIVKVVSGQTEDTLETIASVYGAAVTAGIHKAPSIKAAEAAKVIENTQRDLNIALMNELAIIFDRLGIPTRDVLSAARTKWNFLPFSPGLVGGHCIGVDPYYLTTRAQQAGYHPQVILAGRRINDDMGRYIAQKTVKLLIKNDIQPKRSRIGILGLTFKENVSDVRNSRVPDIVNELADFGATVTVHDPHVDPEEAWKEYKIELQPWESLRELDVVIMAVSHRCFTERKPAELSAMLKRNGIIIDIKNAVDRKAVPQNLTYWSL